MDNRGRGFHLLDITGLSSEDRERVVVTRNIVNGQAVPVSFYGDDVWDISPHISVKTNRWSVLNFATSLGDGSFLNDIENVCLQESFKRFIFVRWQEKSPHNGKSVRAQTIKNSFNQLLPFIRWMKIHDIVSFSSITPKHVNEYLRYLSENHCKPRTQLLNLQILSIYFDLGEFLEDKIAENPFPDLSAALLLEKSLKSGSLYTIGATTELIPLRLLKKLISGCVNLLDTSEPFLECLEAYTKAKEEASEKIIKAHQLKHPYGFKSCYPNEKKYIEVKIAHKAASKTKPFFQARGIKDIRSLNKRIILLRISAWVVCAGFSGMRESELASLVEGSYIKERGFDEEEFSWLKGKTYKLETEPRAAKWMVPPIVGKAVEVASRLSAPVRKEAEQRIVELEILLKAQNLGAGQLKKFASELSQLKLHQGSIFMGDRLRCWSSMLCRLFLNQIAEYTNMRIEEEDIPELSPSLRQNLGQIWPLANHQFRRTFAVLVARNLMGDIRYLREHFKHWSLDMTLYYTRHEQNYLDTSIMSEIVTERDELQATLLEKWIFSAENLSGGAGQRIVKYRSRKDVKVVKDMRQFAKKIGDDVYIRGTGHSWCMSSGQGCGGYGLYDAIRCASCGEGVIDSTHAAIWTGIKQQQIEVLACQDLGEPIRQRCLDHLTEAERVLQELGV